MYTKQLLETNTLWLFAWIIGLWVVVFFSPIFLYFEFSLRRKEGKKEGREGGREEEGEREVLTLAGESQSPTSLTDAIQMLRRNI
jgi:hypothetical protein